MKIHRVAGTIVLVALALPTWPASAQVPPCEEEATRLGVEAVVYGLPVVVDNPLDRYHIAVWMPLVYNPDGSLDITILRESTGKEKESNWLPAARGDFSVTMRIDRPGGSVIDGPWIPPAVQSVK